MGHAFPLHEVGILAARDLHSNSTRPTFQLRWAWTRAALGLHAYPSYAYPAHAYPAHAYPAHAYASGIAAGIATAYGTAARESQRWSRCSRTALTIHAPDA